MTPSAPEEGKMLEKDIENIIAKYPDEFFPAENFKLVQQQYMINGKRFDILFEDKFSRKIIVEVKRGILSREASGQIMEYYGLLKGRDELQNIELILCANIIPVERKTFLESAGISCKEISIDYINKVATKHGIEINEKKVEEQKHVIKLSKDDNNKDINKVKTLDDFYNRVEFPEGKLIIEYLINYFQSTKVYSGEIRKKGSWFSYGFYRIDQQNRSLYFTFLVNKNSILFYLRKPGQDYLESKNQLETVLNNLNYEINTKKEYKVRLLTVVDARNLCKLIAEKI